MSVCMDGWLSAKSGAILEMIYLLIILKNDSGFEFAWKEFFSLADVFHINRQEQTKIVFNFASNTGQRLTRKTFWLSFIGHSYLSTAANSTEAHLVKTMPFHKFLCFSHLLSTNGLVKILFTTIELRRTFISFCLSRSEINWRSVLIYINSVF